MPHGYIPEPTIQGRQLRLDTLVRLRWLAVAGQALAVLFVSLALEFQFEASLALVLVAMSAWLNILLRIRFSANFRLNETWATVLLGYDALQLSGLLFLSGGLGNPFALLLIGPAVVGATTLGPGSTIVLGSVIVFFATLLAFFHQPLPWYAGEDFRLPAVYVLGQWTALTLSLGFLTFYAFRVAKEGRQLSDALAASEFVLQREQHLHAIDGLAAAAAHELGTPLSTIAVASRELERAVPADSALAEDASLIRGQAERCREILAQLRSLSTDPGSHFGPTPLSQVADEALEPHRGFEDITITMKRQGTDDEPIVPRNPGALHGLRNFIENAVDFAASEVIVSLTWDIDTASIIIEDDGPGFPPDVRERLGEPYQSHRKAWTRGRKSGGGLGLGVFIAKTLLERSGARVRIGNRNGVPGARIEVRWPRKIIDEHLSDYSSDHWQMRGQPTTIRNESG